MDPVGHVASQLKAAFGEKSLYEILGVDVKATAEEISKAYKKGALKYHPDKGGNPELFKALSAAHSILSDSEKRLAYDENGLLDEEEMSGDFDMWYEYYRNLFPKVTISDIEKFEKEYKGSEEEKHDVLKAYEREQGNMTNVMNHIMFAEEGDEQRICKIIDDAISSKEVRVLPKYSKSRNSLLSTKKSKKNKRVLASESTGADSADDDSPEKSPKKGKGARKTAKSSSGPSLEELILSKNAQKSGSAMSKIFEKYGGADAGEYDIDDEAFEATRKKISSKAPKKR